MVGTGTGRRPVPRIPADDSVALVEAAPSEDSVDVPSKPETTDPIKPGDSVVVALADAAWEPVRALVLLSDSPVRGAVEVKGIGAEAFSALVVASLKDADEVVEAVPSMTVERPTVMAPRED